MTLLRSAALVVIGSLALAGAMGCFKSSTSQASSESSSTLSSSPFRSSSASSSPEEEAAQDVSQATQLWVEERGDVASLWRSVGRITESHGLTDWEGDPLTYQAIGRGLRRSGVDGEAYHQIRSELASGDATVTAWIESGYRAGATP